MIRYTKGRLRYLGIFNLKTVIIKDRHANKIGLFQRFNSTCQLDQGKWIISLFESSQQLQDDLVGMLDADYAPVYNKINEFNQNSIIPPSFLKLVNYRPHFPSAPALGPLIEQGYLKEAMSLLKENHRLKKYLTLNEAEKLIIYIAPYPWYAYEAICLYKNRINWVESNEQLLPLILKLAFFNMDFKLFNSVFDHYSKIRHFDIPTNLLILALQVYLKTGNIQISIQLFNQYVMANDGLKNDRVLNVFLSNLYNVTHNPSLCLTSYQLWLSHGNSTTFSIDSFMYNILLESDNEAQISWIENSLITRDKFDSVAIKFGSQVCLKLSKDKELYLKLMESDSLSELKMRSLDEGSHSSLMHNLIYLHLRHQNYSKVYSSIEEFQSRSEFNVAVFTIINHLEKIERPDLMFKFLKHIRVQCNYKFDYRHIIPYWRSSINKYIHSGDKIHIKFRTALKGSKYNSLKFLLKICKIRQKNNTNTADCRWYPKFHPVEVHKEPTSQSPKPFLKDIQEQMYNGVLPNVNLLWKSVLLSDNEEDLEQINDIINKMNSSGKHSSKIDSELFWKERKAGKWVPACKFIENQITKLETKMKNDPCDVSNDLFVLFHFAVKFNRIEDGAKILKLIGQYQIHFQFNDNQANLKFLSMYIKWCLLTRRFTDLVIVLHWLKTSKIVLDGFFVDGLRKMCDVYIQKMMKVLESQYIDSTDETKINELANEKEKLQKILPKVLSYYDEITMELHDKVRRNRKEALVDCSNNFQIFVSWMDEDVETLLKAVQKFKRS